MLGGSGSLGRAVVTAASAAGHDAVAISRSGAAKADVVTGEGLAQALAGADCVVDATNTRDGEALVTGTRNAVAAAAQIASIRHFVGISIVGIDDAPLAYYRAKVRQEQAVMAGGVPWSIVRATQFHDLFARMGEGRHGIVLMVRGAKTQPIDVDEVGPLVIDACVRGPSGRVPDIGGPVVEEWGALIARYNHAVGRRRFVLELPTPTATGRFLRSGKLCCPDRAVGVRTFDDWLAARR